MKTRLPKLRKLSGVGREGVLADLKAVLGLLRIKEALAEIEMRREKRERKSKSCTE